MYELVIENNKTLYSPLIEGEIKWTTERQGAPGKLEFNVLKDEIINFQEGNPVWFKVDDKNVFLGFVWAKKRGKEQIISVTAYDQLRYLKYKDTYMYSKKKASDLIRMIAADHELKVGDIEDTGYVIQQRIRDNETLFDIIYDALQLTFDNTKKLYCLYDDFGKLTLKNLESMKLDLIIGEETAEDFDYTTTLDDVYNKVKLAYDNEKTGKREIYIAKDSNTIASWGVLQYFEKIDEKTNGQLKADTLLKYYNKKNRSFSIKNTLGDVRVRGGSSVIVYLPELGDMSLQNYMLVESVTHRFSDNEHFMDLKLKGRM
ncbi:hydrolase [Defluviitalea raffinosedens]|uniref:Hydrolase n=1 Tax=Defluviitalea raffinosedens TaxID=1450156 RepID=A0A7C8LE38_9FIRM|nr:hydrolase [Defluviitalea raffinosedens]KAE9633710.1 hydrolase [Defluviitalea raffinosedens]